MSNQLTIEELTEKINEYAYELVELQQNISEADAALNKANQSLRTEVETAEEEGRAAVKKARADADNYTNSIREAHEEPLAEAEYSLRDALELYKERYEAVVKENIAGAPLLASLGLPKPKLRRLRRAEARK